jgi:hypothetical protein
MTELTEHIYQLFVAALFAVYGAVVLRASKQCPEHRVWIKRGLFFVSVVGFIFYLFLGIDVIDLPGFAEMRRLFMRGILTVWLTLLICDELRVTRR